MAGKVSEATRGYGSRDHSYSSYSSRSSRRSRLDELDRELNEDYRVMDRRRFGAVLQSLEDELFGSGKLEVLDIVARSECCISGRQLDKILERMGHDADRVCAVERLVHKVVAREGATLSSFTFQSQKSKARRILAS